jgi:hypothetical protein
VAVHDHDWPKGAGAKAVDGVEGELAVVGGPAGLDIELLDELVTDLGRPTHVAGGAHAHRAEVLAAGLEAERPVEGGDTVDVDQRAAAAFGDCPESALGQEAVLGLDPFERRDQPATLAEVSIDQRRHQVEAPQTLLVELALENRRPVLAAVDAVLNESACNTNLAPAPVCAGDGAGRGLTRSLRRHTPSSTTVRF